MHIYNLLPMLSAWDVGSFLENATEQIKEWGGLVIVLIGVAMIIYAVFAVAKNLMSKQQQPNWVSPILLLILGGAFMVGGFEFVAEIADGGKQTIEDLGGTILPYIGMF